MGKLFNHGSYVGSFPVVSELGNEEIDAYTVADLSAGCDVPSYSQLHLSLSIQNLFDHKYRDFIAAPEIGRLGLLRLTYSL